MTALPDQQHRELALDVGNSFIVQAPAGSGKTELLSLRYLSLLSICDEPEEVLAITFTRKAASEMKARILAALASAERDGATTELDDSLAQRRHRIASAALKRAAERDWKILANPNRLKIQTIDSFCFNLASRIPLLSQVGGNPNLTADLERCSDAAIATTLATLNDGTPLSDDIAMLLSHLDNDITQAEKLLTNLLANRDQWLTHILDLHDACQIDRDYLQNSLAELISESLDEVRRFLLDYEPELVELINHAARYLPDFHHCYIDDYQPLSRLPASQPETMAYWQLLSSILLTQKDSWRARIDKRDGFPSSIEGDKEQTALCKMRKQQWSSLLAQLAPEEGLRQGLAYVKLLPDPALEDQQWDFLTALARVLRYLNAQLLLSFRQFKLVDHSQVAAAALSALGSEGEPTDLALALDHRIQHILVDEFQDTSKIQTDLLRLLTTGWEAHDGRTLFLVGDAMQSVYGFRNANVGIYLSVREEGLGDIPLQPLTLQSNFRSQTNVVQWVNQVFATVFPTTANSSRGAVPYSPSVAQQAAIPGQGITAELIGYEADQKPLAQQLEACRVAQRVLQLRQAEPGASIAILVRNRSHLQDLIPELRAAGIQWQATDIDKLDSLPVIDDLQSLTRAILNLGDRIAWLAILRAPWCGLTLADLHSIALDAGDQSIWSSLQNYQHIPMLSTDGRDRLADFTRIVGYALSLRGYCSLHQLVESAWTLLRGAALATDKVEQSSVAYYLELLKEHESGGTLRDYHDFAGKVATAFTPSRVQQTEDSAVHVMTMHKAKGLEFDHVILPGLGAVSRGESRSLLEWHERVNQHGEARLFIAALSRSGGDDDPLYRLLRFEKKRKSEYEDVRLLYIATTRARKSAHLTSVIERNKNGEVTPRKGSLLNYIWPQLQSMDQPQCQLKNLEELTTNQHVPPSIGLAISNQNKLTAIKRFKQPLRLSETEHSYLNPLLKDGSEQSLSQDRLLKESNHEPATTIGTLIHQALEQLVKTPESFTNPAAREHRQNFWRMRLQPLIAEPGDLDEAIDFIETTLTTCQQSSESAWLFDRKLQDSQAELAISKLVSGHLYQFVLDRTFIDHEGVRWIVDYKTAVPDSSLTIEEFVDQQCQLHAGQLATYRQLFEEMESRPVRTALLLTSLPRLVELQ